MASPEIWKDEFLLEKMKSKARLEYGEIFPASDLPWEQCLTLLDGEVLFWFNDAEGNTCTVSALI